MNLEFYNCPRPADISGVKFPQTPEFARYIPDFDLIKKIAVQYETYHNLLVIGHGGSITSYYGITQALVEKTKKRLFFLSTIDPDYIFRLKKQLDEKDTLVVAISKSGETTTQLEMLSQFLGYNLLIITGKNSPLRAIGEELGAQIVTHPTIGGRYTGMTEVSLLPAQIAGLKAEALYSGAKKIYHAYEKDNAAWRGASVLFQLEQMGFVDVFMPFYSSSLFALGGLIVQLCHESFGKNGKGQTYFAHEAPESQHHTNQRFFGGKKNICGFFVSAQSFLHQSSAIYPYKAHSVHIKGRPLFDLNKIPLRDAMQFELQGTMEDARIKGIPLIHQKIASFELAEIGEMVAFWQLFALYSSILRGVDPFDQPQVEASKNISFNKRLAFKGLI